MASRRTMALVVSVASLLVVWGAGVARGTDAGLITGVVFEDRDRDGVHDEAEAGLADHHLVAWTGDGRYAGSVGSDGDGRFRFSGLPDGSYHITYDPWFWWSIREQWVPTTTPSLEPALSVQVVDGAGSARFGWRSIVRSADVDTPLSVHDGPDGLRVESFNDAVDARALHDAVLAGDLVGAEASSVTVRLDLGSQSFTATQVGGAPGSYAGYHAIAYVSWLSWLGGDSMLFHEYGHAWSLYHAHITQQDASLAGYLAARGIADDPRLGSSSDWTPREMIAEDYRQLFGTETARAVPQENKDLPPASAVPGLLAYLAETFTSPPSPSEGDPVPGDEPPAEPEPDEDPAPGIEQLDVNPDPVSTRAQIDFDLTVVGDVVVEILTAKGVLVRRLAAGVLPEGINEVVWDRLGSNGKAVKGGAYVAVVTLTDQRGRSASVSRSFDVANGKR